MLSEYHADGSVTGFYMIRNGRYKHVYYEGLPAQLFDLKADPHELQDLSDSPDMTSVLDECERKLRSVVNPEETNRRAFDDQAELVARHGGARMVRSGGDLGYTPAPGEKPQYG